MLSCESISPVVSLDHYLWQVSVSFNHPPKKRGHMTKRSKYAWDTPTHNQIKIMQIRNTNFQTGSNYNSNWLLSWCLFNTFLSNKCEGMCVCECVWVCVCVCVLPRSRRHAFVPRSLALSHLVHPRATVKAVSSSHKPRGWIHLSSHVEPCKGTEDLRNTEADAAEQFRKLLLWNNLKFSPEAPNRIRK